MSHISSRLHDIFSVILTGISHFQGVQSVLCSWCIFAVNRTPTGHILASVRVFWAFTQLCAWLRWTCARDEQTKKKISKVGRASYEKYAFYAFVHGWATVRAGAVIIIILFSDITYATSCAYFGQVSIIVKRSGSWDRIKLAYFQRKATHMERAAQTVHSIHSNNRYGVHKVTMHVSPNNKCACCSCHKLSHLRSKVFQPK